MLHTYYIYLDKYVCVMDIVCSAPLCACLEQFLLLLLSLMSLCFLLHYFLISFITVVVLIAAGVIFFSLQKSICFNDCCVVVVVIVAVICVDDVSDFATTSLYPLPLPRSMHLSYCI